MSFELFEEVCSKDFLEFKFGGRGYQDQLYDSIAKTKALAGVKVEVKSLNGINNVPIQVVWVTHNFGFLGGSLGCAEGEKITKAFEYALENRLGVCVQCRTGGARMQEGTSSLMQMAKVSVAVEALNKAHLPFISILNDPTYGGVSASYAMQSDVKIAIQDARIGFAGPQVILNTMCEANQEKFDNECPPDFQSAKYVSNYGQLDMVLEGDQAKQSSLENIVGEICSLLTVVRSQVNLSQIDNSSEAHLVNPSEGDLSAPFNYTNSRKITRPQTQDIIAHLFSHFIELTGDGKVGKDRCIRGGLAYLKQADSTLPGIPCIVLGNYKGHTPTTMQEANYGMASPHGYRTALRLMKFAEKFLIPVVTMVDTVGAWPTFECERDGQSEAIATNLTCMAGLQVPIITLVIGEGGSGGALGIGMGNVVGMLSGGYYGVISPEGAASILGRYRNDAEKANQFPIDCQNLAVSQCIYANQLKEIGVVDDIIWEHSGHEETFEDFPILKSRIRHFIFSHLSKLMMLNESDLIQQRYSKYRLLGTFSVVPNIEDRSHLIQAAEEKCSKKKESTSVNGFAKELPSKFVTHLAQLTVTGTSSKYRKLAPAICPSTPPEEPLPRAGYVKATSVTAKNILDRDGPEALAIWVRNQTRCLLTDTTMRDAHQSLLATRVRTEDIVKAARHADIVMHDLFSLECWGGATFDVTMRFLDECPWERLREIRKACPDTCLQMLVRGSNAVGYTSYADNVVAEFIRLAAVNGIDIFRIFDCFNDIESCKVSIDAARQANKIAEVCICYTGNLFTSKIYTLDYYKGVARDAVAAGAHIIAIKDMAGLLMPLEAGPLLAAIREVIPSHIPVHFHTHSTSSGSIATCMEMARAGCDIIDVCTASMADGTSQVSMNAFVAMTAGAAFDTGINYMDLEPYDNYWRNVRDMYSEFESGMKSGSARVFEHQIPGGQYSNLIVQCQSMGLWSRWEEVLNAYRDANELLGDIVKVTPSSKCVGDLALYLVTRNLTAHDLLDPSKAASIDFPESVVGLLRGDLGFPHRGFPEKVERVVLKGEAKRTVRAGLTMTPTNFEENIANLSKKWNCQITAEQAMSSLMYPKVFSDYMTVMKDKGGLVMRYLPTPVYLHGCAPGQSFTMKVPKKYLSWGNGDIEEVNNKCILLPKGSYDESLDPEHFVDVEIALDRVAPLKNNFREVIFTINNSHQQVVKVKDTTGIFVFEGPMVAPGNPKHVGSPMPGQVEKLLVAEGQSVKAGDILCTISAMKMEVKVTAPHDSVIGTLHVGVGTKVIEGALLITLN